MKTFILAAIVTLSSLSSLAASEFYQCTLPQAEEFRVGIDLKSKKAGFFDNDSTSIMTYVASRASTSNNANEVLVFIGKDKGGTGQLKLEFNTGTNRIKLSTLETDGTLELLGYASCNLAQAWDLNEDEFQGN